MQIAVVNAGRVQLFIDRDIEGLRLDRRVLRQVRGDRQLAGGFGWQTRI